MNQRELSMNQIGSDSLRKYRRTSFFVVTCFLVISAAAADKAKLVSHKEMMSKLATLATVDDLTGRGRVSVACVGKSVRGRDIPLVVLSEPHALIRNTKRLFVICRQHGDEPAPTEAMLKLIQDLALSDSDETTYVLSKVSFFIVPMMNPDGAERNTRRNSNGVDLNRDWMDLSQPETRCVRRAIDAVEPDIIIDAHELSPGNKRSDFVETVGLASGAGREVVSACLKLQEMILGVLRIHDIHALSYRIEDRNPACLAHRYFPVHGNTASILLETRQSGIRQYQLEYRKSLHITSVMTVAKCLAGQEDRLLERIAQYDSNRRLVQLASRKSKRTPLKHSWK